MMSFTQKPNQFDEDKSNMDRTELIARDLLKYKKDMEPGAYNAARKHMLAGRLDKAQNFIDAARAKK